MLTRESHIRRGDYRKRFLTPLGWIVAGLVALTVLLAMIATFTAILEKLA